MTIRLDMFGRLRGSLDGNVLEGLTRRDLSAAMLVYVSVERQATRDTLLALLWPDQNSATARHRLSQMVYALRQSLGDDCIDVSGRDIGAGQGVEVDVRDFERAVDEGRIADAAALYRGPFLDGVHLAGTNGFQHWVDGKREHYARVFRESCRSAVEKLTEAGEAQDALAIARAWARADPFDDESHYRLIDLLSRAGRRMEALRQYSVYRDVLDDAGLEPLDEIGRLVREIKRSSSRSAGEIGLPAGTDSGSDTADTDASMRAWLAPELEIVREIGRGSTATVYLAREPALERLVAIKVLDSTLAHDEVARLRFVREAKSAARIVHSNVAQIFRLGAIDGSIPFIVMEYIDGRSLRARLLMRGTLPADEIRTILRAVASALAVAHDRGVVHRDVRPENILIETRTDRPVLTDFGIAALLETGGQVVIRLTPVGRSPGNPGYMSPEQVRGQPVTDLSDVYAFGIVGYEMLAGGHPFASDDPQRLMTAHVHEKPRPLRTLMTYVPPELATIIERCLAKDPRDRPGAQDLVSMLSREAP